MTAGTAAAEDPAGLDFVQRQFGQIPGQAFEHVAEGLAAPDGALEGVEEALAHRRDRPVQVLHAHGPAVENLDQLMPQLRQQPAQAAQPLGLGAEQGVGLRQPRGQRPTQGLEALHLIVQPDEAPRRLPEPGVEPQQRVLGGVEIVSAAKSRTPAEGERSDAPTGLRLAAVTEEWNRLDSRVRGSDIVLLLTRDFRFKSNTYFGPDT